VVVLQSAGLLLDMNISVECLYHIIIIKEVLIYKDLLSLNL